MQLHPATLRFIGAVIAAALITIVAIIVGQPRYALLIAPTALALVYVAWTLSATLRLTPAIARKRADTEDAGPLVAEILIAIAAIGALASVVAVIALGVPATRVLDAFLCLLATWASWAMVHVMFAGRYARLYWTNPAGGIDFAGDSEPVTLDFLYFSFNLGMTFQVSDTTVTSARIRHTVLGHCLVSYIFGTMIIACAINLVLGLVA